MKQAGGADDLEPVPAVQSRMEQIGIVLVDDHGPTREEMVSLIQEEEGLGVVGQAAGGEEGVRLAISLSPDVVVMDLVMPGMNGIEATRAIRRVDPEVRILALSNHTGHHLVQAVMKAGASGYVRKDQAYEELIPAILAVARGREYVGSRVSD